MNKSRKNVDISQLENLSIDNAENPRSKRKSPRINHRALSKIVSDIDGDTIDEQAHQPRSQPVKQTPKASAKRAKGKPKPKPDLEPLPPLTAAEHINVSCRFVLKPESLLTPFNINVDTPIPSHYIWRVISPPRDCPICLDVAEVPRMLGCGHIMCIHCMVQHGQFSETPSICPICGDTVNTNTVRTMPVSFIHADPAFLPKDGDEVILTLMSRPANSALALPVDVENPRNSRFKRFPSADYIYWTRVCQSGLDYAKAELSRELKYLIGASKKSVEEYGSDEGYNDGISEIKRYLQMLNTQYDDQNAQKSQKSPRGPSVEEEPLYFYQTAFESTTIYTLDSLDVSILRHAFGSPDKFPATLIAKVGNVQHTVYDRLRDKRLKYLAHLPEQTPISFIECDWEGILSSEVLEKFSTKIAERKRHKKQMQARDLADRKKAQASIERQFQLEVAEAMLPHADVGVPDTAGIDTTQLPSLPRNAVAPRPPQEDDKHWVDEAKLRDEMLTNAYVPKRGRKEMILRF